MKRYRIHYRDLDPACPVFRCIVKAYSREHAREVFFDTDPDDPDWKIIKVERI
jgi:hypothetical protein